MFWEEHPRFTVIYHLSQPLAVFIQNAYQVSNIFVGSFGKEDYVIRIHHVGDCWPTNTSFNAINVSAP